MGSSNLNRTMGYLLKINDGLMVFKQQNHSLGSVVI